MDDFASLLYGDEPTTQERMRALASQLQRRQAVGQLASLIGGPAKDFGAGLTRSADQGLQQLGELPGQRLQLALQKQKLGQEQDAQTRANRPVGTALQTLMGKMAPVLTPSTMQGMTEADAEKIFPALSAYSAKEDAAKQRALTAKLMGQPGGPGSLDDAALNALADQVAATGKMPQLGMGKASTAMRAEIMNRAVQRHPDVNLAGAGAGYGADTAALKKLQSQASTVNAFENTALANLRQAREAFKGVANVGSPFFNRPIREISDRLAGSPQQAAFNAARQVMIGEVSKVVSGQTGGGVVSDSARQEMAHLLSPDATPAQFDAVMNVLEKDMANRRGGFDAELGALRGHIGGGGNPPAAAPIPSTSGNVGGLTPDEAKELEALRAHFGGKK